MVYSSLARTCHDSITTKYNLTINAIQLFEVSMKDITSHYKTTHKKGAVSSPFEVSIQNLVNGNER